MRSLAVACLFSKDAPFCARPAKGKLKYENPPLPPPFLLKNLGSYFYAPIVSPISIEQRQQSGEMVDLERAGRKKLLDGSALREGRRSTAVKMAVEEDQRGDGTMEGPREQPTTYH